MAWILIYRLKLVFFKTYQTLDNNDGHAGPGVGGLSSGCAGSALTCLGPHSDLPNPDWSVPGDPVL